jgi:hypothetical protein
MLWSPPEEVDESLPPSLVFTCVSLLVLAMQMVLREAVLRDVGTVGATDAGSAADA